MIDHEFALGFSREKYRALNCLCLRDWRSGFQESQGVGPTGVLQLLSQIEEDRVVFGVHPTSQPRIRHLGPLVDDFAIAGRRNLADRFAYEDLVSADAGICEGLDMGKAALNEDRVEREVAEGSTSSRSRASRSELPPCSSSAQCSACR